MIWVELHENKASRAKLRCLQMLIYRSRYVIMPQNCCVPEGKKKVYIENGVKISFHIYEMERRYSKRNRQTFPSDNAHKSLLETFQAIGLSSFNCGHKRTLKPTSVPSVFHWKKRSPVKQEEVQEERGHRKENCEG